MANKQYDVIIIGGGPAGYVAAIQAARLGGQVVLVERDELGGTCLNRGCIPTKAYLHNAHWIAGAKSAAKRGIVVAKDAISIDMPKTLAMKQRVVKRLTTGVGVLMRENKIDVVRGDARVKEGLTVDVLGENPTTLTGKKIILAGGSKPSRLPIPGIDGPRVVTSDDVLDWDFLPESLAILGGGVIGIEMARIFAAFGVKVTIVELEDRLAPFFDAEISKALGQSMKKHGVKLRLGTRVENIVDSGESVTLETGDEKPIEAEYVLAATGRVPVLDCVEGLEIKTERGAITVNDRMETSIEGIYAAGDITGQTMLAHSAFKMGETAAANAMGHDETCDLRNVPGVIYGEPEVGCVGLTEAEAAEICKEKCGEIAVGRFPFQANGRALASGETEGFAKVVTCKKSGRILGVHIMGPGASELVNEASLAIANKLTAEQLAETIHAHPTCSEALMEASADALGAALHLPPRK